MIGSPATGYQENFLGGYDITRHALAGHSYSYTYYPAAWGVGGPDTTGDHLPIAGHHAISLIAPRITDPGGNGTEYDFAQRRRAEPQRAPDRQGHGGLRRAGQRRVPAPASSRRAGTRSPTTLPATFPAIPASRFPPPCLSPRVTLSWRFYATPAPGRHHPGVLGIVRPDWPERQDQAKPGSRTTVKVTPIRSSSDPNAPVVSDSVSTKLKAWWSSDGAHWHRSRWPTRPPAGPSRCPTRLAALSPCGRRSPAATATPRPRPSTRPTPSHNPQKPRLVEWQGRHPDALSRQLSAASKIMPPGRRPQRPT